MHRKGKKVKSALIIVGCTCALIASCSVCQQRTAASPTNRSSKQAKSMPETKSEFTKLFNEAKAAVDYTERMRKIGAAEDSSTAAWQALDKALKAAQAYGADDLRVAEVQMLYGRYKPLVGNITTEHYDAAARIYKRFDTADNAHTAEALEGLAAQQARSGKHKEAAQSLQQVINIVGEHKGNGSAQLADALNQCRKNGMNQTELKRTAESALAMMTKTLPPNDESLARVSYIIAAAQSTRAYHAQPDDKDSVAMAINKSITALRMAPMPAASRNVSREYIAHQRDLQLADMYETLAERQRDNGNNAASIKTYEIAVKLREKSADSDNHLLGLTYNRMAEILRNSGKPKEAEAYKLRELEIWKKVPGPSNLNLINAYNSMVAFYSNDYAKQIAYYQLLLPLEQKLNPASITPVENLAKTYALAGKYAQAEPYLKQWLEYSEKHQQGSYDSIAVMTLLGNAEVNLGKFDEAGIYLNRVKAYYEKQPGGMFGFGEKLPEPFLALYTTYLEKAHKPEYTAYKQRLDALRAHTLDACPACGRG